MVGAEGRGRTPANCHMRVKRRINQIVLANCIRYEPQLLINRVTVHLGTSPNFSD